MKKMIYLGTLDSQKDPRLINDGNEPKKNQLVFVYIKNNDKGYYTISGYECDKKGREQEFSYRVFAEPKTSAIGSLVEELKSNPEWTEEKVEAMEKRFSLTEDF